MISTRLFTILSSACALLVSALCPVGFVFADEPMNVNVAVCNLGGVRAQIVADAKAETETVFSSAGVRIVWTACGDISSPAVQARGALFIIRLRTDKPPRTTGPLSLDTMGRAYVADDGGGYLADAYFPAIQAVADHYGGSASALLGLVIAHELGHLLRGAGHSLDGVMTTPWRGNEMNALRKRSLKFSAEDGARIRRALQVSER